mgnify:CR=1 FL=1
MTWPPAVILSHAPRLPCFAAPRLVTSISGRVVRRWLNTDDEYDDTNPAATAPAAAAAATPLAAPTMMKPSGGRHISSTSNAPSSRRRALSTGEQRTEVRLLQQALRYREAAFDAEIAKAQSELRRAAPTESQLRRKRERALSAALSAAVNKHSPPASLGAAADYVRDTDNTILATTEGASPPLSSSASSRQPHNGRRAVPNRGGSSSEEEYFAPLRWLLPHDWTTHPPLLMPPRHHHRGGGRHGRQQEDANGDLPPPEDGGQGSRSSSSWHHTAAGRRHIERTQRLLSRAHAALGSYGATLQVQPRRPIWSEKDEFGSSSNGQHDDHAALLRAVTTDRVALAAQGGNATWNPQTGAPDLTNLDALLRMWSLRATPSDIAFHCDVAHQWCNIEESSRRDKERLRRLLQREEEEEVAAGRRRARRMAVGKSRVEKSTGGRKQQLMLRRRRKRPSQKKMVIGDGTSWRGSAAPDDERRVANDTLKAAARIMPRPPSFSQPPSAAASAFDRIVRIQGGGSISPKATTFFFPEAHRFIRSAGFLTDPN